MKPIRSNAHRRRGGFALLITLLLLVLLIAGVGQVVTQTSVAAVTAGRRSATLAHELAVDSALLVLMQRLEDDHPSGIMRELDLGRSARLTVEVGEVTAYCTIQDDAARLNPNLFARPDQEPLLQRKLRALGAGLALPQARIDCRPLPPRDGRDAGLAYRWFDQLLCDAEPGSWFAWDTDTAVPVWSDALTFWGDGRIDLRRVDQPVLDAALEDLQPGLARKIIASRPADRAQNFLQPALRLANAEVRPRVAARLAFDLRRYALQVDTTLRGDRRRWFIVLRAGEESWQVMHRSELRW